MSKVEIKEAAQWVDMPALNAEDCPIVLAMQSWQHIQAACFLRGFDCRGLFPIEASIKCDMGIFDFLKSVEVDAIDLGRFGNVARKAGLQYVFASPDEWLQWAQDKQLLGRPWPKYLAESSTTPRWIFAQKNEREWLIGSIDDPVVIKRKPHASLRGIDLLHTVLSRPVHDGFDGYDAVTMEAHLTRAAFGAIDDDQVAEMHELEFTEEGGVSLSDQMSAEELSEYRQRLTDQLKTHERRRSELEEQKEQYEDAAHEAGLELDDSSAPQGITFRDITAQYQEIIEQLATVDTDIDFFRKELNEYSPQFSDKKRHTGRHKAYNATWTKIRKERDSLASERGLEEFGSYLKQTITIKERMIGYRPPEREPVIQLEMEGATTPQP